MIEDDVAAQLGEEEIEPGTVNCSSADCNWIAGERTFSKSNGLILTIKSVIDDHGINWTSQNCAREAHDRQEKQCLDLFFHHSSLRLYLEVDRQQKSFDSCLQL